MNKFSYVQHLPGHKNSKGEPAPYVIKSHETNEILSSHKTKDEADSHLKDMHVHGCAFMGVTSVEELIKFSKEKENFE